MKQLTRLEAIQELYLAMGEMPPEAIESSPEGTLAELYLNKTTLEVLNTTEFNKKVLTEIPEDFTNIIKIDNEGWLLIQDTIIDVETKEPIVLENEELVVVLYIPFEECPYPVQNYILTKACRKLQDKVNPDTTTFRISKEDEIRAFYDMEDFDDASTVNPNMLWNMGGQK
jgi:hypothetical protein